MGRTREDQEGPQFLLFCLYFPDSETKCILVLFLLLFELTIKGIQKYQRFNSSYLPLNTLEEYFDDHGNVHWSLLWDHSYIVLAHF